MQPNWSFITLDGLREYYKSKCENDEIIFSDGEFEKFAVCCKRDFYQWLSDNYKWFTVNESAIDTATSP